MFIDPLAGNEVALGYDLASEPSVAELVHRAQRAGETEVSAPVELPYRQALHMGVLAAIPVYAPDFAPSTAAARSSQLQGFVVGVFIIDELLNAIESRSEGLHLDLMLSDVTPPSAEIVIGVRINGKPGADLASPALAKFRVDPTASKDVPIGGRTLRFVFRRSATWERAFAWWVPTAVLGVGLLLTVILVQFIWASSARATRIESVVQIRTAELAQANAKLQQEVHERLEAQNRLAGERNLLYLLLNQLPDAVYVTDREGKPVVANEAHARLLQQAEATDPRQPEVLRAGAAMLSEALASGLTEVLQSGKPLLEQETLVRFSPSDARHFEVSKLPFRDARGEIDGLLLIARDVTEHRRAEAQKLEFTRRLQETQRLESLGILAGGIAHDFNNLLTTILGNATLARNELGETSPTSKFLHRIESTVIRAANLCKQMLAYSGRGHFVVRRLDLSHLVEQTTELLRLSINKKATLELQLAIEPTPVMADATQLQQILMNLVINASEAVGDREGIIRVKTAVTQVDREYLRQAAATTDISEGPCVLLEVSDNGCGMNAETQARVFDPFFTTKFTGRGLGLAAVLGIVRGHRGAVILRSEPGVGTTFRLLLPKAEGPIEASAKVGPKLDGWRGSGRLLLVDDEEEVRNTTALMLEQIGFSLDHVPDGRAGLEKFREAPDRYRAVLLDLTMPHLDGVEAFREIRRLRPEARVLLMSGFSSQDVLNRFGDNAPSGFIQKPFLLDDLLLALRRIL
jgi:PAS domain S-box-containing protein